VRPVVVVVLLEGVENCRRVALIKDQDAVDEFAADGATKRSAMALARGARTDVVMILKLTAAKTASKVSVNLSSRSRMRNRNRWPVRAQNPVRSR
jgi:hypothetical protein